MARLKFLTWNVRGLGDKLKRTAVFSFLKNQRAGVIVLVETHVQGHLQRALRRLSIGWAYHATHTSYSRGISVLVSKSVPFEVQSVVLDPQGRYLFLYAKIAGNSILILAWYIPPPFNATILSEGFSFMAKYQGVLAIWVGDFNIVTNPSLDCLGQSSQPPMPNHDTRFSCLMTGFDLVDTWRHLYPKCQAYSCLSSSHSTMSCIDHVWLASTLTPRLHNAGFGPRFLSDHSTYWIELMSFDNPLPWIGDWTLFG